MEPCTYVIFGATGNLSKIKLMPALYHLEVAGLLPEGTKIIASGRRAWTLEKLHQEARAMIRAKARNGLDEAVFARFQARLSYFQGDLSVADMYPALAALFASHSEYPGNVAFYMAIRPADFGTVVENLSTHQLLDETHGWRRVIIEKPFGYDLESAHALQQRLMRYLREEQIFRIDHYLGKGTVRNVQVFRFANVMLEPLWNRNYIDHVQITHSENLGVGSRADYYDGAGAMRDMIQSHLLQLLTLVAMEPPASMEAEALRNEKVKVLQSIRSIPSDAVHAQTYRAQYTSGRIQGEKTKAYLDEDNVPPCSVTETYAAMKLYIDNWRWAGVPFYLRTGKRMAENQSVVSICFKAPPKQFFRTSQLQKMRPNWVLLGIQPCAYLKLEMTVKEPGMEMHTRQTTLDANLREGDVPATDAYEDLLLDVIKGDQSLFLRYDEVEAAWRVVDPVLRVWAMERDYIPTYPAGSWGPEESRRLFEREDQNWRDSMNPATKN
ncbi:glucose-6-phosphate dehydrogenase [Candidatus Venteria ishoeyi]|uniref:Glucose-6-phosphate 1-dehydrogenase n=1 Tax=Candidatus Venteria ishoeyi TaxID=1899563 RepID=A0A1H6FA94_9GAMM|nr:glucose-6-phosphate dehydrogenase [Candidatus Venteria ishoeyi]MDM8547648.1 glucose-6-phosphate dehydrogenase [Candidatus Venteria ishoeyi]SEH05925.1 Glucose-6-phosphate 1-dehydrogenase [Candidatus Venteria ishoeyi]